MRDVGFRDVEDSVFLAGFVARTAAALVHLTTLEALGVNILIHHVHVG